MYEVGQRITDHFDDAAPGRGARDPKVFIMGDACHTHSAKAGQGLNVSVQDAFNLGWKLGLALRGLAPSSLLSTCSAERRAIAQNLIDFDREWSSMMVRGWQAELSARLTQPLKSICQSWFAASFSNRIEAFAPPIGGAIR